MAFTGLDAPEPPTTERLTEVLTPREREVLALLAEGRSNTSIAETLYVSERTVDSHVTAIFGKLGLDRTADAKPTRAGRGGTAERRSRLGAKLRSGAGAGQRGS
ncbi:response regulator transcription factor [Microbacterium sp.]|uniref:response regulator transcription factor n=1 Tax=Microbacterium sp. TaxID=51671 RepID=UPI003C74D617